MDGHSSQEEPGVVSPPRERQLCEDRLGWGSKSSKPHIACLFTVKTSFCFQLSIILKVRLSPAKLSP